MTSITEPDFKINWIFLAQTINEKFGLDKTGSSTGMTFFKFCFKLILTSCYNVAQHYKRVILADNTADTWTKEEEKELISHVNENGPRKWSVIAQQINRTGTYRIVQNISIIQ